MTKKTAKVASTLTFKTYSAIIKVAFGEELERVQEYLYFIESGEDVVDDKPWTAQVEAPPSFNQVQAFLSRVEDYSLKEIASMVEDENAEEEDLEVLVNAIREAYMDS